MGARARLELGEQMADVRLHGLLGEEEPLPDLAHRRLLLELAQRSLERDDLGACGRAAAGSDLLETPRMAGVAVENFLALCGVHAGGIGPVEGPLQRYGLPRTRDSHRNVYARRG